MPSFSPSSRTSTLYRSASGSTTRPCSIISLDDGHAVVVGLDRVGALGAAGLDRVGVDGALAEQVALDAQPLRLALEHVDERVADDRPLLLGLDHAGERREERVAGVDEVEVAVEAELAEHLDHRRGSRPCASGRCRCAAGAGAPGRWPCRAAARPPWSRRRRTRAGTRTGRRPAAGPASSRSST